MGENHNRQALHDHDGCDIGCYMQRSGQCSAWLQCRAQLTPRRRIHPAFPPPICLASSLAHPSPNHPLHPARLRRGSRTLHHPPPSFVHALHLRQPFRPQHHRPGSDAPDPPARCGACARCGARGRRGACRRDEAGVEEGAGQGEGAAGNERLCHGELASGDPDQRRDLVSVRDSRMSEHIDMSGSGP